MLRLSLCLQTLLSESFSYNTFANAQGFNFVVANN
jgi:hypothetical protein